MQQVGTAAAARTVGDELEAGGMWAEVRRELEGILRQKGDLSDETREAVISRTEDTLLQKSDEVIVSSFRAFAKAIARRHLANVLRLLQRHDLLLADYARVFEEQQDSSGSDSGPEDESSASGSVPEGPRRGKRNTACRRRERRETPEGFSKLESGQLVPGVVDPETHEVSHGTESSASIEATDRRALQELALVFAATCGNSADLVNGEVASLDELIADLYAVSSQAAADISREDASELVAHADRIPPPPPVLLAVSGEVPQADPGEVARTALHGGRSLCQLHGGYACEFLLTMVRNAYKAMFGIMPSDIPWRELACQLLSLVGDELARADDAPEWCPEQASKDIIFRWFDVKAEELQRLAQRGTLARGGGRKKNLWHLILKLVNDRRKAAGLPRMKRDAAFGDDARRSFLVLCYRFGLELWPPWANAMYVVR